MGVRTAATLTGVSRAVLSPHLDDAVLSCWHLLAGAEDVVVVNVCTASPAPGTPAPEWDRRTGAGDPVVRMDERRAEDARALRHAGRRALGLGLLDAQYRRAEPSVPDLVAQLGRVLEPGAVLYAPAGLGGHPDHELVRAAALELARAGWDVALYADLPHAIRRGWPAWVAGDGDPAGAGIGREWRRTLEGAGLDPDLLTPRVHALRGAARGRKLAALAEYRTQRAALDEMAFVPLDDPRALAFEVVWEVPASALGASVAQSREQVPGLPGTRRQAVGVGLPDHLAE